MPPTIFHSPVDQVVSKLPNSQVSKTLVKKTNEQLRILETRIGVGKLGRLDRSEVRAAVVLEYVARQEGNLRLSLKELAAAVGIKQKNLQELHAVIGNYLQPTHQATSTKRKVATNASSNVAASTRNQASRRQQQELGASKRRKLRSNEERCSIIPNLAIRLVAQVADPHGLSQKAQNLMRDIQNYIHTLPAHERRGWVYDMQRYGPAYEAAAFYCVQQQRDGNKSSSNRSNETEENEHRSLELEDLLEASNQFTYLQLKEVLPHVKELAAKAQKQPPVDQATSTAAAATASAPAATKKPKDPPKSSRNDCLVLDEDNLESQDEQDPVQQQAASFQAWKEQTLAQAQEKARKALEETMMSPDGITNAQIVQRAADDILHKYGLLTA